MSQLKEVLEALAPMWLATEASVFVLSPYIDNSAFKNQGHQEE